MNGDEMDWSTWGTIGDAFGGCANFITLGVVIYGAFWARKEVRRARSIHKHQLRADAARQIFRNMMRTIVTLDFLSSLVRSGALKQVQQQAYDQLLGIPGDVSILLADASLYFGDQLQAEMEAVRTELTAFASNFASATAEPGQQTELEAARVRTMAVLAKMRHRLQVLVEEESAASA